MLRLLVIFLLGLQFAIDYCNGSGFEELCRKQYCNKSNTEACRNCKCPTRNGPSMSPSESATFSCGDCSPGTMYLPYVCKNCYEGTEENEAFSCQRCKLGKIKSKPVICDACESNPSHDATPGFHNIIILIFDLLLCQSNRHFV